MPVPRILLRGMSRPMLVTFAGRLSPLLARGPLGRGGAGLLLPPLPFERVEVRAHYVLHAPLETLDVRGVDPRGDFPLARDCSDQAPGPLRLSISLRLHKFSRRSVSFEQVELCNSIKSINVQGNIKPLFSGAVSMKREFEMLSSQFLIMSLKIFNTCLTAE